MNQYSSGEINIIEVENINELPTSIDYDLLISNTPFDDCLKYPTKVIFTMDIPSSTEVFLENLESTKRSSIRKRIRKSEENFEIKFIENLTKEEFLDWLSGYKSFIASIDYGSLKLDETWYEEGSKTHIAIFFYKNNQLEGGALIKKITDNQKLSISFAWYNEELRKTGASTYVVARLFEYGNLNSFKYISFGQDTNLYGGHLPIGLHDFKSSWGSKVSVGSKAEIKYLKVNNTNKKFKFYIIEQDNSLKLVSNG